MTDDQRRPASEAIRAARSSSPMRWPLAAAGLFAFVTAGGFAVADEDLRLMVYTLTVVGSVLLGAWIYALGAHNYAGESLADTPAAPPNGRGTGPVRDTKSPQLGGQHDQPEL